MKRSGNTGVLEGFVLFLCLTVIAVFGNEAIISQAFAQGEPKTNCVPNGGVIDGYCNDPHTWSNDGGGPTACGQCPNLTYTYDGGTCTGAISVSASTPQCQDCTQDPASVTYTYPTLAHSTGYWLACVALTVGCGAAAAGCLVVCCAGTIGLACAACLVGCGGGGVAGCGCIFNNCATYCGPPGAPTTAGTADGC